MYEDIQFTLLQTIVLWAIPLLFAIIVHEVAHGWIANKLGDPTAKMLGRLTLNPIKHIDPVGTLLIPALTAWLGGFIFGWAKPVPITWINLKHQRRDMFIVALAGPFANILMAVLWAAIAKSGEYLQADQIVSGVALEAMGKIGIYVNAMLAILNLLPLQPLDGGRMLSSLLPPKAAYHFDRIEPYGFMILLVLLVTNMLNYIMLPPLHWVVTTLHHIFGL
jgi:Zn-dependent protease